MNCRRHGSKTSVALWMLIAVTDLAILVTGAGAATILLTLAGLVVLTAGVIAARPLLRRAAGASGVGAREIGAREIGAREIGAGEALQRRRAQRRNTPATPREKTRIA